MQYTSFLTELGIIRVYFTDKGVRRIDLPGINVNRKEKAVCNRCESSLPEYLTELGKRLTLHMEGISVAYDFPLDLSGASVFCQQVLDAVINIPYGEVRNYKWVASEIGNAGAFRAVGQVLARNPVPVIIPCHRVISSNGKPGGFAGRMSCIQTKLKLLFIEGYTFL